MSFSSDAKAELCALRRERKCCAVAECYGILLYCNTFSPQEIRIITASRELIQLLPRLFKKAFGVSFDALPQRDAPGKQSFVITDTEKLRIIYESFGLEYGDTLALHLNFPVVENDCCRTALVRGAFLAGGSVTDPEKRFHLELATRHKSVSRELYSLLLEMGAAPKEAVRGSSCLLYFKQADRIADFFTSIGAPSTAMSVMTAKVDKEMRNTVTRRVNCDSANVDKTVAASREQIRAIKTLIREYGLDGLPDPLRDAALLRLANPEASLSDLAQLSYPPVTKSCLSHRLKKLTEYAQAVKKP